MGDNPFLEIVPSLEVSITGSIGALKSPQNIRFPCFLENLLDELMRIFIGSIDVHNCVDYIVY